MPDVSGTRPFLEGPLDGSEPLLQWVKYLGTTFGTAGALCALRYYEGLSWISPAVRREVEQHLQGLSLEETHSKKYDEPGHLTGPLASLSGTPFGAHAKSLEYIATLADDDLEGEMLRARLAKHRVDGDLVQPTEGADGPAPSPPSES
jgi:archaellum component FlaD/FlaE